jgi:hypothetical protein
MPKRKLITLVLILLASWITLAQQASRVGTSESSPHTSRANNQAESPLTEPVPDLQARASVLNIFGFIFGVVGVAGTIYTYLSWRSGRKRERVYKYLFEVAEKGIDAKATEEKLVKGREEVKEVSQRIDELQNRIRRDIPREAKRAVLTDRLNSQMTHLMELFESVKRTQTDLREIGDQADIPPEIRKEIEAEIMPEFLLRDRRSSLKTYLTIITTAAAISSAILPYPFSTWISFVLLVLAVPVIALLVKYTLPVDRADRRKQILLGLSIVFFIGSLTSLFFGAILTSLIWQDKSSLTRTGRQSIPVLFVVGFLCAMVGILALFKRRIRLSNKR